MVLFSLPLVVVQGLGFGLWPKDPKDRLAGVLVCASWE